MYDFILTEGDLRDVLAKMEMYRRTSDRAYCLQIHVEPGLGTIQVVRASIEPLTRDVIAEMRTNGEFEAT